MSKHKNLHLGMIGWGILLAGAFAFSSCVNDEADGSLETTGKAIGFNTSYGKGTWEADQIRAAKDNADDSSLLQSRGALISTVNADWGYKVGAYYHLPNNGGCKDYFNENSTGGYQVANSTGTATTNYYWPPAGEMQFFAVAPVVEGLNVPTASTIDTPVLTYTIPTTVADQEDIMVANPASTVSCPQTSAVDLQFQHLLAAVQFKVGEMENIQINALTVSGVKGGTVTMTYDEDNSAWVYSNNNNNVSYSPSPLTLSSFAEGTPITDNSNQSMLLVMPQELGATALLTIDYTDTTTGSETKGKSVALTGTWEAGKITNYYLNIKQGLPLTLTVEVQPWELITVTNEFSKTVTVNSSGKIRWTEGTAENITGNIVTLKDDITRPAEFTFTIAGPLGGTWKAFFATQSGDPNAFSLSQYEGSVGTECTVTVKANKENTSTTDNIAELRFAVLTGQDILPVDNLTTFENGSNYVILQEIKVQQ